MKIDMKALADDTILAGSVTGKSVFIRLIEAANTDPDAPTALLLDFRQVEVATASFLRESVFALKSYMRARNAAYYPIVANLNDEIKDELTVLTDALGDALIACKTTNTGAVSNVELIGNLDPKQRITFEYVVEHKIADANTLKQELGDSEKTKSTTAWNNRLAGLVARGVVKEFSRGRAKFYKPIVDEVA